jgi:hypothetical protein
MVLSMVTDVRNGVNATKRAAKAAEGRSGWGWVEKRLKRRKQLSVAPELGALYAGSGATIPR